MSEPDLDFVSIGRSSVDLYGQQIGGRLEDMASFAKSVGGSPTNMAIGGARLGLRPGLITAVGDEHMGRFILEQLAREGVATEGVKIDRERLTALVLLGVRDDRRFPLIFYRENCADMALTEADVDERLISRAKAVVVTGTHLSTPGTAAMSRKAMEIARRRSRKVVLDIDYRPNLWGLAGHGAGEERYIRSDTVSAHVQSFLGLCDLVVGTEEELHIAGGTTDTLGAIRAVRALTDATIVCKRGPMGCVVFPGDIPTDIEDGIKGPGFPVEVYNVLGAGDAFMAGFLRGWLRGEPIETACAYANACGAFAVSRLLCSPEYPTFEELSHFLAHGSAHRALRQDEALRHLHWVTTRRPSPPGIRALAIDHRAQIEAMAEACGAPLERIGAFKRLAVAAARRIAEGRPGFGLLLDGTYGREALFDVAEDPFWIGRPIEKPGSRPLEFEAADLGTQLVEWPLSQTVKCLCFYHPDDPADLRRAQEAALQTAYAACRGSGRELMIEIMAGKHGPLDDDTVARVRARLYAIGIMPDWWKLEPQASDAAWEAIAAAIEASDPHCRGVVTLGLDAPEEELAAAFPIAARCRVVKGFAIGRTIFAEAAQEWLAGRLCDDAAVDDMAARFGRLAASWDEAVARAGVGA